jgi:hypothetical protein
MSPEAPISSETFPQGSGEIEVSFLGLERLTCRQCLWRFDCTWAPMMELLAAVQGTIFRHLLGTLVF